MGLRMKKLQHLSMLLYLVVFNTSIVPIRLFCCIIFLDTLSIKVVEHLENEYLKPYFDNTERLENLSYAIGYYRKEKGLSQEQLAEKLGISRQHLAAVEAPRMNRGLSLELLFNIASVLEIEPYLLLKFRLQK